MKKMKERIVSAVFMVLIFIPILLLGGITFSMFMTLLAIAGIYELIKVRENIFDEAGCVFNLNSPKQKQQVFFERLKLRCSGQNQLP